MNCRICGRYCVDYHSLGTHLKLHKIKSKDSVVVKKGDAFISLTSSEFEDFYVVVFDANAHTYPD
jgi:hypothetical protein